MNRRDFLRAGLRSALLVAAVTTGLGRTSIQPEKIAEAAEYQWKEYGVTVSLPNDKASRSVAQLIEKRMLQTRRSIERSLRGKDGTPGQV